MAASGRTQGTSCLCREPCPELILKVENLPPHPSPAHCPVCILLNSLPSIIIWFINAFTCLLSGSCKPITSVPTGVFVFVFLFFFLPLLPLCLEPCLVCCWCLINIYGMNERTCEYLKDTPVARSSLCESVSYSVLSDSLRPCGL